MGYSTSVMSNGNGAHTIDDLISLLDKHIIQERYFSAFEGPINKETGKPSLEQFCPIKVYQGGMYCFWGDFENHTHRFRIFTNDPSLIKRLSTAIQANRGWQLYYHKNLINNQVKV